MDTMERARRYIAKLPPALAGSGGHDATFKAACVLVEGFALDESTAMELLSEWNVSHCTPPWSDAALLHKVKSAAANGGPSGFLLGAGKPAQKTIFSRAAVAVESKWPRLDLMALERVIAKGESVADLFDQSPMKGDPDVEPYNYLSRLFESGSLVCVGKDAKHAETLPVEALEDQEGRGIDLRNYQFIVPSPMKAKHGLNLEGRRSVRCLDNTGPRRFLVIECDFEPKDKRGRVKPEAVLFKDEATTAGDLCAAVLLHLAEFAPLVMAVDSGGKSVHGWFAVWGRTEDELMNFMRYAVSLGGDKATWTRCQYVRMPNALRDSGKRQRVMYFNPELIERI